jgi:hypothetical protein
MIGSCFGFSGGNHGSSDYNVFMHHDAVVSHRAINYEGGPFDGSLGHHSSDGGHSHGGDSVGTPVEIRAAADTDLSRK